MGACMELIERSWLNMVRLLTGLQAQMWRVAARGAGQSTVEYALVGALVVIAAATAMTALGGQVTAVFSHITATLSGSAPAAH